MSSAMDLAERSQLGSLSMPHPENWHDADRILYGSGEGSEAERAWEILEALESRLANGLSLPQIGEAVVFGIDGELIRVKRSGPDHVFIRLVDFPQRQIVQPRRKLGSGAETRWWLFGFFCSLLTVFIVGGGLYLLGPSFLESLPFW